jgi:hypothetical protein
MARPEWRDRSKERFWRGILREFRRSDLTIREFCARRSLAEHNFHAWRRILAERDQERAAPEFVPVEVVGTVPNAVPNAAPNAAPNAPTSTGCSAAIEIELPSGAVVRVRDGVDGTTLRRVLTALTERASQQTSEGPSC